jgi:hypothetical protein
VIVLGRKPLQCRKPAPPAERFEMTTDLLYGTVVERPRRVIHVLRVAQGELELWQIDEIAEKMRKRMLSRHGEQMADVVVVQGHTKRNLRLFGEPASINRVRAALFNVAVSWAPITLD